MDTRFNSRFKQPNRAPNRFRFDPKKNIEINNAHVFSDPFFSVPALSNESKDQEKNDSYISLCERIKHQENHCAESELTINNKPFDTSFALPSGWVQLPQTNNNVDIQPPQMTSQIIQALIDKHESYIDEYNAIHGETAYQDLHWLPPIYSDESSDTRSEYSDESD